MPPYCYTRFPAIKPHIKFLEILKNGFQKHRFWTLVGETRYRASSITHSGKPQEDKRMETTALTDSKPVMYTSDQVQQMLDMVVRSLSRQGQNNAPVNLDNVINQVTPSDAKITLTVTEAADMLGISLPKMYEIVRIGRIPSIRVGKKIVISRQAVLDWLKEGD